MSELKEDLATLTGAVVSTQAAVAELDERSGEREATLADEIAGMNRRLRALPGNLKTLCPEPAASVERCAEQPTVMVENERLLLGELEEVFLDPPGVHVVARMDTGADSSSLNAQNLTQFERDGEDWVRFDWVIKEQTYEVERPILRYVRVIQQADPEGTRRPVVSLRLRIGATDDVFDFTLADRSHLDYQMILGRNFLTNVAVVDVGRRFVQPRLSLASP
ncbi:MAG: RimK/LysX family protein [Pseudomonadota bacterium]